MYYRSQLFVPGNRPDRFEKACTAGADLVCMDLEDAVGPADKDEARKTVLDWLRHTQYTHVSLRMNSPGTGAGVKDVKALAGSGLALPFVMIPKVGSTGELEALDRALPGQLGPFFPVIESASGLVNVHEIFAHPRVKLGLYGAIDYAAEVDCDQGRDSHLYARSRLVAAAAAFDVQLFDVPHVNVRDLEDCEETTRHAKALGIHARSAIHPAQIERIHAALMPGRDEIAQAKRIIEADRKSAGNVSLVDGKMVETPIVRKARRILALAGR